MSRGLLVMLRQPKFKKNNNKRIRATTIVFNTVVLNPNNNKRICTDTIVFNTYSVES